MVLAVAYVDRRITVSRLKTMHFHVYYSRKWSDED